MSYQILLGLEQRLMCHFKFPHQGRGQDSEALSQRLQLRAAVDSARIGAALRWTLEPQGRICDLDEWGSIRLLERPDPEHVIVVCGAAHVPELQQRLQDSVGNSAAAYRFLAKNAGLLPRLLINATSWSWEAQSSPAGLLETLETVSGFSQPSQELGSLPLVREDSDSGLVGPLAAIATYAWKALGSAGVNVNRSGHATGPVFIQERLRSLSQRPLPVWPIFLVCYIITPVMAFIVIPIAADMRWLRAWTVLPELPETLLEEKRSTRLRVCERSTQLATASFATYATSARISPLFIGRMLNSCA